MRPQPVSVVPLLAPEDERKEPAQPPPPREPHRTLLERALQLPPLPRIPASAPAPAAAPAPPPVDVEAQRGVRVAVLVAMPVQTRRHRADDEPLPELVFGTADVVWDRKA